MKANITLLVHAHNFTKVKVAIDILEIKQTRKHSNIKEICNAKVKLISNISNKTKIRAVF